MGCYGAFNAMKVADAFCKSNPAACVLVVCIEICTIHFQKNMHLDNIISNSIFADGAACVLIQSAPNGNKYFTLENFYNYLLPQSQQEIAWHIGDYGFDIVLSTYVPEVIRSGIGAFMKNLTNFSDIDYFAIHPGGSKISEACEQALNINKNDNRFSYKVLRQYGNMSSATVIFLKEIWNDIGFDSHNKNIFSCAFGPGLTLESMLLKTHC